EPGDVDEEVKRNAGPGASRELLGGCEGETKYEDGRMGSQRWPNMCEVPRMERSEHQRVQGDVSPGRNRRQKVPSEDPLFGERGDEPRADDARHEDQEREVPRRAACRPYSRPRDVRSQEA